MSWGHEGSLTLTVPITDTMVDTVRRQMLDRGEEPDQHPADCECSECENDRAQNDDYDCHLSFLDD